MADNCEYGDFKSQMIRDRLVVGIRDTALSERLQMNAELTLEKAMKMIQQSEAVREQQTFLNEKEQKFESGNLDSLKPKRQHQQSSRAKSTRSSTGKVCGHCGKGPHGRDKCPAREATCHRCQKIGHYSSQCRAKVGAGQHIDTAFLDVQTGDHNSSWIEEICLNNHSIPFKLDTRAEVTAVSETVFANRDKTAESVTNSFGTSTTKIGGFGSV